MKSITDFIDILKEVKFADWQFIVQLDGNRPYLQVRFEANDNVTGHPGIQYGRKWFLSPHMTNSEVVLTAFKAVMTAIEHEARERFLYRDRAILGPHIDVEALHSIAQKQDTRV